jgi:hypothetical protein
MDSGKSFGLGWPRKDFFPSTQKLERDDLLAHQKELLLTELYLGAVKLF